jgi:hypothetical protein
VNKVVYLQLRMNKVVNLWFYARAILLQQNYS